MNDLFYYSGVQYDYFKKGVSITVKHYESGTYSFVVQEHNGDATGWTKISGFLNKSSYNYVDALRDGIEWYEKYLLEKENEVVKKVQVAKSDGTDFGSIVSYKF